MGKIRRTLWTPARVRAVILAAASLLTALATVIVALK
jgi:hypothetical protein